MYTRPCINDIAALYPGIDRNPTSGDGFQLKNYQSRVCRARSCPRVIAKIDRSVCALRGTITGDKRYHAIRYHFVCANPSTLKDVNSFACLVISFIGIYYRSILTIEHRLRHNFFYRKFQCFSKLSIFK